MGWSSGHADCVRFVRTFNTPLVILGGGGYTVRNVARTWAYETAVCVGEELSVDMPFNEYMEYFGPEFKMEVQATNMEDLNERPYLEAIKCVPCSPHRRYSVAYFSSGDAQDPSP